VPSETIINAVVALCEAFGRTATEATIGAYDIGLRGLTDSQVTAATGLALQRCKFMPVPAELRELAVGAGQSYEGMAERAFLVLDNAVRRHSDMVSINFADGLLNATVRVLGGWPVLHEDAMTTERFTVWFRKDFLATYVRLAKSGASPDLCRYLPGKCERENAKWEGCALPSGQTYQIDQMQPIENIGVEYTPALPSPPVTERKRIGASREFLKLNAPA
jgi:hypothetical protein